MRPSSAKTRPRSWRSADWSSAYQYNQGSGQVIGQPQLRPGDNVALLGLGTRISGHIASAKSITRSAGRDTSLNST